MLNIFKSFVVGSLLAVTIVGCTRIDDTSVGIRKEFSGVIQDEVVAQGLHQVIVGDIIKVSKRNLVIPVNSQPIVVEKIPMAAFEVKVNYGIVPQNAAIAYKTEKAQHLETDDGEMYLLGKYVEYVANSSIQDVVSKYKALEVNDNRAIIEKQIKDNINAKLKDQGKSRFVSVNEINILKVIPPASITESSAKIVRTENELKAKQNELEIARVEQTKMSVLSQQADGQYINLLKAEAEKTKAEALLVAAQKGTLNTMVIVPEKFTSVGNTK